MEKSNILLETTLNRTIRQMRVYPNSVWVSSKYILINLNSFVGIIFLSLLVLTSFCLLIFGVEGNCCTWSHSVTHTHAHTHTHSVGLLWTRDRPVPETPTWQHTTFTRDRHPRPRRDSNPQSQQASDRRSMPLDHAATEIDLGIINSEYYRILPPTTFLTCTIQIAEVLLFVIAESIPLYVTFHIKRQVILYTAVYCCIIHTETYMFRRGSD
jgi:hypothetical protein